MFHDIIAVENDVLYIHFPGRGVWVRLKRWWSDLFLLSYEDTRSKHYYMGSNAMMMARAAQFRNERTIHPFSKFRNFWDCLMLHLIIYRMVIFHINSSVIHTPHIFFFYSMVFIDFVFLVDLYVNAKTGYAINKTRQVIINPRDILLNYLSTTAFIHAMSAIPFQTLMWVRLGKEVTNPVSRANLFVCTLKLLSLIQTVKLFEVSAYWAKDRGSFARTVAFKFIRILAVGLIVTYQIMSLTTTINIINAIQTGKLRNNSFTGFLVVYRYLFGVDVEINLIFVTLSRVNKNFFLFGFGLYPITDVADQISVIINYSVAFPFHFWAGIILYSCISRDSSMEDRIYAARAQTYNIFRIRGLSDSIHTKVENYYDYNMSAIMILEKKNCLFKALPSVLTSEIKMYCYKKLMEKIPCFAKCPAEVIAKLIDALQPDIYMVNDKIICAHTSNDGMIILESGLLAVYSDEQEEIAHLGDGDHFGEEALVTDRENLFTVVAVTSSLVLQLHRMAFRIIMAEYPDIFCSLRMDYLLTTVPPVTAEQTGTGESGTGETGNAPEP